MEKTDAYLPLNKSWKACCRMMIGGEVGELEEFAQYLQSNVEEVFQKKSFLSGKQVIVSNSLFPRKARYISNNESEQYLSLLSKKPFEPSSIKDIDSLLAAAKERSAYAGNIVIGKSAAVEQSDAVADSQSVLLSSEVYGSKYVAYSANSRGDEHIFGVNWSGESKFLIKCFQTYKQVRCMETLRVFTSSDCYYSANIEGCFDCIFCFNQRNARHMIGNLQLPPSQYAAKKAELLSQLRQLLSDKKAAPSIIQLLE